MAPFSRISLPMVLFYSTFLASKCQDQRNSGIQFNSDELIHIYRTEVPGQPPLYPFDAEKNNFAFLAWIAVLSVVISVAVIVVICCLCWKLYPKYASRRQSSSAALVSPPNPETIVTFQARTNQNVDIGLRNTGTDNAYSSGFVNIAFSNFPEGSLNLPYDEGPPAYTAVISDASPTGKPASMKYPRLVEGVKVETPPPAYMTVAPFQQQIETDQK